MGRNFQDDRPTDLFGNPVRPSTGKRGRPCLEISQDDRDVVEAALVRGWTNERIARTLGISPASLKRHFRAALDKRDQARDRMEAAAFAKLAREAIENGNMTAMRQLREVLAADAMTRNKADLERRQKEAEARGIGMGKKQVAQMQAEEADDWGGLLNPSELH